MKKQIFIFDSESTGHHLEYVQHIAQYVCENGLSYDVTLAVHPEVAASVRPYAGSPSLTIQEIAPEIISRIEGASSLWRRSLYEWSIAQQFAEEANARHLLLLTLNRFQVGLASPSGFQVTFTVSGIIFSPYPRLTQISNGAVDRLYNSIKRFRKKTLMWLMMRNASISAVHVLNDPPAADYLNRTIDNKRNRFKALPDPVQVLPAPSVNANVRTRYEVEQKRTLFLFFGTLSERKGIFRVVDAFAKLSEKVQREAALLLLGRPKDGQEEDIQKKVHALQHESVVQVRTDFRFLEPEELSLALEGCDVVLAPYQRTEGSSGVIGHAARFKRPVIGPRSGLIGELIRAYGLGNTIDTNSTKALTNALTAAVQDGVTFNIKKANCYVEERSSKAFARGLFDATVCKKS